MFIAELSKFHHPLSVAEYHALTKDIIGADKNLILSEKDHSAILERSAFTKRFYEVIHEDIEVQDPYAIRRLNLREKNHVTPMKDLVETAQRHGLREVDLDNPKTELYWILSDKEYVAIKRFENTTSYDGRRPDQFPAPHPTGMQPRLTRCLLNILQPKEVVQDPFCGAGGFLVEAAVLGYDVLGSDMSQEMVWRAKKNISAYTDNFKVSVQNALEVELEDYIIADLPYGKNSYLDTSVAELTEAFLERCASQEVKRVVLSYPYIYGIVRAVKKFNEVEHFDLYVNKSLSRRVSVLEFS